MIRSLVYGLVLVFLFASASQAQSPPIGAVVQTWRYDAATKQLVVRVVNTSGKDITALNLSVTEKYADGTTNLSERTTDYLPLMASIEASPGLQLKYGNGTFAAGSSRDIAIPEPKDVVDASIILDMVAYADRSADVTNERAFSHLVADRKEILSAMQQANQAMKDALATPDPKSSAVKELTRLADVAKGSGGGGLTELTLRGLVQNAESIDVTALIKDGETRAVIFAAHAQLVKGGQR
jgi:hypothetical protein